MSEPTIYDVVDQFRAELLKKERQAASRLVHAYGAVWRRIKQRLDELGVQMQQAKTRGDDVSPEWLLQHERLQLLRLHVAREVQAFAQYAGGQIIDEQADILRLAQRHAEELMRLGLGETPPGATMTFARLPASTLTSLVGSLQPTSPLRDLLDELGPTASQHVQQALIAGVATGQPLPQIAAQIRQSLGGNLSRALTIARTEVLRSYREASRRLYYENQHIVVEWTWHSALDDKTCAFCWAMHGSTHPTSKPMATHPNCRCAEVPITRPWSAFIPSSDFDTTARIERGPQVFATLSEPEQRAILRPAKFLAYKTGALRLEDLPGFYRDRRWGEIGYERSLTDILGPKAAQTFARRAQSEMRE